MSDDTQQLPFLIDLGEQLAERAAADEERLRRRGRTGRRWAERRRRDLRGRTAATGAAGLIAAVALALLLTLDLGGSGRRVAPAPATAQAVLVRAAETAAARPDTVPRADQLFFVRSLTTRVQGLGRPPTAAQSRVVSVDRRIWTSPTRPGRLIETPTAIRPLLGGTATRLPRGERPVALEPERYRIGGVRLTRAQLLRFPTDPARIVARLRAARPGIASAELFDQLGAALAEFPAPPAVRAGLFGALSRVAAVELVGDVRDSRGRPGVAVGSRANGVRTELIVDPRTAELLSERRVLLDPPAAGLRGFPVGTVLSSTTYLRRAAVDSVDDQ